MKTTDKQKFTLFLGLLLVLLTLGTTLKAQLPSPPNPPRLVNDYTGTLSSSQINTLERKLVAYDDSTSTQILVLLVDDLQGYSVEQYATEIGHSWGVGQKGKNNGAVILVKPKKGSERGQVNISPGYGMEQYITDATAKRIIEREMIPAFREDDYYTGIDNAVNVIMDLCSGKFTQDEYGENEGSALFGFLFFIALILLILYLRHNNQSYSSGGSHSIWIPMGGGGFGGGGFGGFGGGGFGGGSGGGFGGFGGGGFGGGGASGSW